MAEFDEFESGMAVMEMPEEEKEAAEQAAVAVEKPVAEAQAPAAQEEEGYDVDIGFDMEWEVETEPPEEPAMETVQETVVEEYYEPGYRRGYDPGYGQDYDHGYGQGYNRGYGQGYNRGYGQGYYQERRVARRFNKHIFTWVLSFVLGLYGVDRFARGQVGLGMLKLLTFGGFGVWYLCDVVIALIMAYGGPYRNSEDVTFDQYGQYI